MSQWTPVVVAVLGAFAALYAALVVALFVLGRGQEARAIAGFVPDCIVLFSRVIRDPCVPRGRRILLACLVAYLTSPIDLVPDFLPVVGHLDDAILAAFVLRRILRGCEEEIPAHWPGPQQSLAVLMRLSGAHRSSSQ